VARSGFGLCPADGLKAAAGTACIEVNMTLKTILVTLCLICVAWLSEEMSKTARDEISLRSEVLWQAEKDMQSLCYEIGGFDRQIESLKYSRSFNTDRILALHKERQERFNLLPTSDYPAAVEISISVIERKVLKLLAAVKRLDVEIPEREEEKREQVPLLQAKIADLEREFGFSGALVYENDVIKDRAIKSLVIQRNLWACLLAALILILMNICPAIRYLVYGVLGYLLFNSVTDKSN
jgi:hypothetical protein